MDRTCSRLEPSGVATTNRAPCIPRLRNPTALGLLLLVSPPTLGAATREIPGPLFVEASDSAGLHFVHFNGAAGRYHFPEINGSGIALFDFDGDGDLDLYLVQGDWLASDRDRERAWFLPRDDAPLSDRLYRNDLGPLSRGAAQPRFVDITGRAGIPSGGYGMGVAVGDIDNDGWIDLYVTNVGSNRMLRNRGDGTFADVTEESGTDDARWSVSAAFLDVDRDGWLDLYVGNYVDFSLTKQVPCFGNTGLRDYCGPESYQDVPDRLFRNLADGSFEDVTGRAGLAQVSGAGLGVVVTDFDGDGWTDIYVANDGMSNRLWINQRDGTFADEALLRGCALNADGRAEASMGVDAADFDGDGDEDLFVTHLNRETNTLYENDGSGYFRDRSVASGLGMPSWQMTGFGTAWLDFDNDGLLDLLAVNGAVTSLETLRQQRDPYPFHQPNQLYRNLGEGRFEDVTRLAGPALTASEVSRGTAVGDIDNDGDVDVVVANNSGPARLLLNRTGQENLWLGLRPLAPELPLEAIGARVVVRRALQPPLWRRVRRVASYASASDPRVLVGLGLEVSRERLVEVRWPGGGIQRYLELPVDRYATLRQSPSGRP